jgi:hypothetical protein
MSFQVAIKHTNNEKEDIIYVLEFKRVSDAGHEYVTETQQLVEAQYLVVTQGLQKLFKDTQWTVVQLSFVTGHKSVSASICHDLAGRTGESLLIVLGPQIGCLGWTAPSTWAQC